MSGAGLSYCCDYMALTEMHFGPGTQTNGNFGYAKRYPST